MWNFTKAFSAVVVGIALLIGFAGSHVPSGREAARSTRPITLAKFYQLADGMSYEDAAEVLGSPGEMVARNTLPGVGTIDPVTTVMVEWRNPGIFEGNMSATFQNGRLVGKAQFGLH